MSETNSLLPAIANRWSPRTYKDAPIDPETLHKLFEAARWASSCFNEQPWRFVIATKADPEQFARVLNVLVPQNQQWAKNAWVLGITAGKKTFTHNGAPNRFGLPRFYTLHVWAWKENPQGAFVNWHPNVSCDTYATQKP